MKPYVLLLLLLLISCETYEEKQVYVSRAYLNGEVWKLDTLNLVKEIADSAKYYFYISNSDTAIYSYYEKLGNDSTIFFWGTKVYGKYSLKRPPPPHPRHVPAYFQGEKTFISGNKHFNIKRYFYDMEYSGDSELLLFLNEEFGIIQLSAFKTMYLFESEDPELSLLSDLINNDSTAFTDWYWEEN